ncbi:Valine--tRNA ligase [Poriferisphaera corsica]|uniref:Valine--tRNA ligase n=1 Tax=Poriferisphaera corsica TaxID=2528020 RepID=A0A517YYH0_9BACT|nr:valine--tRNA ligase [Poriferisphaera corsica]QDU35269.1 Valine--tRNA ligase [Poriferisphaera corsica]
MSENQEMEQGQAQQVGGFELASQYRPEAVEDAMAAKWDAVKAWHGDPSDEGEAYGVVIPPPNVTAALHLGHALNNTLQDVLVRYNRMLGKNAMWMPGTDHAGIATQTVVEKRVMAEEGKKRTDFERDEFVGKIQAWKDEYEGVISSQLKLMGCSCDWDRQRFTMDEQCAKAVREAFYKLFKDDLIYRGKRLVNWDPATQTALADDEVEMQDVDGSFWYMKYPVVEKNDDGEWVDTGDFATVATTRPETMLGDTAVAVNPDDEPRAKFIGMHVRLPIVGRIIPIVGDDYVVIPDEKSDDAKAKMASGFLKVTPAHDPNDWEIGLRHNLPVINVMGPDGAISKDFGWEDWDECTIQEIEPILGLSREEARKWIVRWFKEKELMAEIKPYRHAVGHSYRSHVAVEPWLSDQWYVKVADDRLAGAALRAMKQEQRQELDGCVWKRGDSFACKDGRAAQGEWEGGLEFQPPRYAKTFQMWHENIRDWCISRQLWWGHRIPVWSFKHDEKIDSRSEEQLRLMLETLVAMRNEDRIALQHNDTDMQGQQRQVDLSASYICVRSEDDADAVKLLEDLGFEQDPDVLDTWFSSALWPMSTMGWVNDRALDAANEVLQKWNPTSVLSTAREIITLWVSRMVMFNVYFMNRLPFKDVFIHAMIQDGHGQKMSKSLGNGVDPLDIIHSHGADAMRFTLTSMTTQTQDVRMSVDMVDPHSGETFTPKYITASGGHKVAAPEQEYKGGQMISSYGVASGVAKPREDVPAARNTSEKFDYGQRFANKLWNAVRFSLGNLSEGEQADGPVSPSDEGLGVADRWIIGRLANVMNGASKALEGYEFSVYTQDLYDFFWRDLCDWYIEAVKPTIRENGKQKQVLATCIDVSLRLLHPSMPFVTEKLWEALNAVMPNRGIEGIDAEGSGLLMKAAWPKVNVLHVDEHAGEIFEKMQAVIGAIREVRTTYKVVPRETVEVSVRGPKHAIERVLVEGGFAEALANVKLVAFGDEVEKPGDAAVTTVGEFEVYLHGLIDADTERTRLDKRKSELVKSVGALKGRLSNSSYVDKAPEHLVQQTRDQLMEAEKELASVESQLAALS